MSVLIMWLLLSIISATAFWALRMMVIVPRGWVILIMVFRIISY